jgi:hypothetical protein
MKDVKKFMDALAIPEGFTKTFGTEDYSWGKEKVLHPSVIFTKGTDIEIKIVITSPTDKYMAGSGHTSFNTKLGRRTFDRRGVEDSFYVEPGLDVEKTNAQILRQIEKVAESVARMERSKAIPVLGFTVTPEAFEEIKAKLAKGKSHTFTPAGFGTGYVISKKRSRFARFCDQQVIDFFGVGALYQETLDCD